MSKRARPSRPTSYTPDAYDAHREAVGEAVAKRLRAERLTPTTACRRYGAVSSKVWADISRGDHFAQGLDTLLSAAAAMGIQFELVEA